MSVSRKRIFDLLAAATAVGEEYRWATNLQRSSQVACDAKWKRLEGLVRRFTAVMKPKKRKWTRRRRTAIYTGYFGG